MPIDIVSTVNIQRYVLAYFMQIQNNIRSTGTELGLTQLKQADFKSLLPFKRIKSGLKSHAMLMTQIDLSSKRREQSLRHKMFCTGSELHQTTCTVHVLFAIF